jgi:hypothetical protein
VGVGYGHRLREYESPVLPPLAEGTVSHVGSETDINSSLIGSGSQWVSDPTGLQRAELDRIAEVLQSGPFAGYPNAADRLFLNTPGLKIDEDSRIITVPEGPWMVSDHPNRMRANLDRLDPLTPPEDLMLRWRQADYFLTQQGWPVHPDFRSLLTDERIGLPAGPGYFWKFGENETVDPVVYRVGTRGTQFLLIRRGDGGQWALPGGFKDRDESVEAAARREAGEETSLTELGGNAEVIFHKRSVGLRDTLNAWTENTVVLIHSNQEYLHDYEPHGT